VLVDGNLTSRKGIELLLRSWGHHVIGATDRASNGPDLIRKRRPHVAVVDLDFREVEPVLHAATACGVRVVLLLGQLDRRQLDEVLSCDAAGLVLKSADPGELRQAICEVGRGERFVAPAVKQLIARHRPNLGSMLSRREREVLQLLASGMTGVQASKHLTVSPETVRTHIRNARRRLGARTRVHAVAMALAQREIHS
jgi:DNA-binding NarL/FixJ family response regulator